MKKKFLIPGLVLVLVIAAVAVLYYLPVVKDPALEPKAYASTLYTALAGTGIDDTVVDITPERVLIRYNLPENMSKEAVQYYIMGSAATAVPESSKIVIQTYENFEPVEEATVDTKDVLAFMNESITFDEFKERIIVKSLK